MDTTQVIGSVQLTPAPVWTPILVRGAAPGPGAELTSEWRACTVEDLHELLFATHTDYQIGQLLPRIQEMYPEVFDAWSKDIPLAHRQELRVMLGIQIPDGATGDFTWAALMRHVQELHRHDREQSAKVLELRDELEQGRRWEMETRQKLKEILEGFVGTVNDSAGCNSYISEIELAASALRRSYQELEQRITALSSEVGEHIGSSPAETVRRYEFVRDVLARLVTAVGKTTEARSDEEVLHQVTNKIACWRKRADKYYRLRADHHRLLAKYEFVMSVVRGPCPSEMSSAEYRYELKKAVLRTDRAERRLEQETMRADEAASQLFNVSIELDQVRAELARVRADLDRHCGNRPISTT